MGEKRNKAVLSPLFQRYFPSQPLTLSDYRCPLQQKMSLLMPGGKRDSGIPFSPAPCCWKNSSALRHSSATDLDVNPHRIYAEYETYFNFFTLMSVNAVISMRPGGQDMERGKGDFGRWFSSLASDALTGFPTQVGAACLCSRCLASRKPSKRTPFRGGLEDG